MSSVHSSFRVVLLCALLTACAHVSTDNRSSVHTARDVASFEVPLYPYVHWTLPELALRTIETPSGTREIKGREIVGTYDDATDTSVLNPESDYADQDFWRYYLKDSALYQLGYEMLTDESEDNRAFAVLYSLDGHHVFLSHIVEPDEIQNSEYYCPCEYTFTIFTDDPRILLE